MKTRHRLVVISLLACVGSVLLAQAASPTPAQDSHAALLAEVRALRAEVHQATSAGIRMQLLVARLQLQEQRVLMAGRQLLEVQNALATVRQEIAGEQARVEQLEKSLSRSTAHGQLPLRQAILEAKAQIERQQRQEQELQVQETQSVKAVNDAQIQWMDFSRRLDELERSVPIESTR
jgi:hypothetical protein